MTTTIDSAPALRRLLAALPRRWPSLLGVATFLLVGATGVAGVVAPALMLLPTVYLLALAVGRRWTWPLVVAILAVWAGLQALDLDPRTTLLVAAGAGLGVAVVRGRGRHEVLLQGVGLVGFAAVAFTAAAMAPQVAGWAVAAAWFAHGVWDVVHLCRDVVVSRSFAEWCGVVDVLTAAAIVLGATSLAA